MMKKQPQYATEAALCADFIAWVKSRGGKFDSGRQIPVWTSYAETAGWDILLVAADGTQIGVQAKLKFNMKVLTQSVPSSWSSWHDQGPDYRAVLVPEHDRGHGDLCAALGLMLFAPSHGWGEPSFRPSLHMDHSEGWHFWSPRKRCELPEFVPDVIAGDSGPVQLTKWKIAALRVIAILELRGHVTRQDFRTIGIDPRRWTGPGGWVVPKSDLMQDAGQFVRGPELDFDKQHPVVYAQVLAEAKAKMLEVLA